MKNFVIFTSGVIVGGVLVYLYFNKYEEYEVVEEVNPKPLHFKENKPDLNTVVSDVNKNFNMEEPIVIESKNIENVFQEKNEKITEEYNTVSNDISDEKLSIEDLKKPVLVKSDKYVEDDDYAMQNLTYYFKSDLVIDDAYGEIFPEAFDEKVIGKDIFEEIKQDSSDDDIFYVRNSKLKIDYEIVKSYDEYSEEDYSFKSDESNIEEEDEWNDFDEEVNKYDDDFDEEEYDQYDKYYE